MTVVTRLHCRLREIIAEHREFFMLPLARRGSVLRSQFARYLWEQRARGAK